MPIASYSHGWLIGRGLSRARPFPAHSIVTRSVRARQGLDFMERQGVRPLDRAANLEPPCRWIDVRNVEVDQQVVQAGWRHVVAQRLERHAPVARRQLQLLEAERIVRQRQRRRRGLPTSGQS